MRTSLRSKKIENYRNIKSDKMDTSLLYNKYYSNQSVLFDNIYENIVIDNVTPINSGERNIIMGVNNNVNITTGTDNIVFGISAGSDIETGNNNITLGNTAGAGTILNRSNAIAIGPAAVQGGGFAGDDFVAIGYEVSNPGSNSVYIGCNAGSDLILESVCIGNDAGAFGGRNSDISLGTKAGYRNQQTRSMAIGFEAGESNQQTKSIAIGFRAGTCNQNSNSIAIGGEAGSLLQGSNSIAIGRICGSNNQGNFAIAMGSTNIASINQGNNAIAIGAFSNAPTGQGVNCISIGNTTLQTIVNPTTDSFFIGPNISTTANTPTGVFAFNTSGTSFSPENSTNPTGGLFIKGAIRALDIASNAASNGILYYNPSTYEVNYNVS